MDTRWLIGLVALVALLLTGVEFWRGQSNDAPTPPTTSSTTRESGSPQDAPDFQFADVNGAWWTLSDLLDRPTVISFLALWDETCELEVEAFKAVQLAHSGAFNFVLVDVDTWRDSATALRAFADKHKNPDFLFVFDEGQALQAAFKVRQLQTTVVLDTDGQVVHRDDDVTERAELEAVLASLN